MITSLICVISYMIMVLTFVFFCFPWFLLWDFEGLLRCGKSCRLRWINYLRSDLKRGNISSEEEETIIKLHSSMGNRLVQQSS